MSVKSVYGLLPLELQELVTACGEKRFRADQILNWVYTKRISCLDRMKNLGDSTKAALAECLSFELPEIEEEKESADGTRKYLLRLKDDNYIEMVLIPAQDKLTLCISSQVGCQRGCNFCATARLGFIRNLETFEITAQIYLACLIAQAQQITNIVFMGMGEPLDNYDNVIKAIQILQSEKCFSISPRRITVSTCGVIPGIYKLADSGIKVKLAVSLNAALDEKRKKLMPVTREYPLVELKKALRYFSSHTPFRITFEYVMIKNFNIYKEDQKALRGITGDISSKINLIAWNPVPGLSWETPSEEEVTSFKEALYKTNGVAVTERNSRGSDINAACGMLAGKKR